MKRAKKRVMKKKSPKAPSKKLKRSQKTLSRPKKKQPPRSPVKPSKKGKTMLRSSAKKPATRKKTTVAKKASHRTKTPPKSFLHKMLTAEGWKRLIMKKSSKG